MNVLPAFIGFFASFLLSVISSYFMVVSRKNGFSDYMRYFKQMMNNGFVLMFLFILIVMFQILFT